MTSRAIYVVDIETSGLDRHQSDILEVAWVNLDDPDDFGGFVPELPSKWLERADLEALAVNRFIERRGWEQALSQDETVELWSEFREDLGGTVFAGVNPQFDAQFIARDLAGYGHKPPWHYRLLDLGSMACGTLEIDPHEVPSSAEIFQMLDVVNEAPHTALGDAQATAAAFRKLMKPKGVTA